MNTNVPRRSVVLRPNSMALSHLLNELASGNFMSPLHGDALPRSIKIDVSESESEYVVHAEIPGASKEAIHVGIDGNAVSIRASISQIDRQEGEKSLKAERYYGEVSRQFQLQSDLDEQQSKAKYDNGVLTLTLVKKAKPSGQRLTIE